MLRYVSGELEHDVRNNKNTQETAWVTDQKEKHLETSLLKFDKFLIFSWPSSGLILEFTQELNCQVFTIKIY